MNDRKKKRNKYVRDIEKCPIYQGKISKGSKAMTVGQIEDPSWHGQVIRSLTYDSDQPDMDVRVLGEGLMVRNKRSGLNNHDLIVGASSAGKTRGYVIPNLFYGNESKIVSDTKGNLCKRYGKALRKMGYRVENLNIVDPKLSTLGYNPLEFIRKDESGQYSATDIRKIAEGLCPLNLCDEPFWAQQGAMYLEFAISYVCEVYSEKYHTFSSVEEVINLIGQNQLKDDLLKLSAKKPGCLAVRTYPKILSHIQAEKMHGSILGIVNRAINGVLDNDMEKIYNHDRRLSFDDLAKKKMIVFVTVSDTDSTRDILINLFYTQALQELIRIADNSPGSRLKVPVRMIIDDYASSASVSELDRIISVIRSRNISISIILQSLSQLIAKHGEAKATTIIDNFDNQLFYGSQNIVSAEHFSRMSDKLPVSLLTMPLDKEYVFIRGQKPEIYDKYDLCRHERELIDMYKLSTHRNKEDHMDYKEEEV